MRVKLCLLIILGFALACQNKPVHQKPIVVRPKPPVYLSQKVLEDYVAQAFVVNPESAPKPFDKLAFDKVIAYDFDGGKDRALSPKEKNGAFASVIKRQRALNQGELAQMLGILNNKAIYARTGAACFNPHFGLVFFNAKNEVAQISICLDCDQIASSVKIPAMQFVNGKDRYIAEGISKIGEKKIEEFVHTIFEN